MRHTNNPTYVKDIVEDIQRVDERDIMFARQDLFRYFGEDSEAFNEYYRNNPEQLEFDKKISRSVPLGGNNPDDAPIFRSQFKLIDRLGLEEVVDGAPAKKRLKFTEDQAAEKVKAIAKMFGADLVNIGPLKREWTYSYTGCTLGDQKGFLPRGAEIDLSRHPHAIVLGFHMDLRLLASAPYFPTLLATAQAYALSAWTAVRLAETIRMLGYSARAHHFSNYQALLVPVAVDCGMGELSRAGYLLTKEFGLSLRLSAVTTDLPLAHDRPIDIAAQSFCGQCRRCADECPSGAIPKGEKVLHNGVRRWKLDEEKCYAYWHVNGTDCGICMAICPWTKPRTLFHKLNAELASEKGPHQRFMAWADRVVYGKHQPAPPPDYLSQAVRNSFLF